MPWCCHTSRSAEEDDDTEDEEEETENLIPCSQDKRGISDLGNIYRDIYTFDCLSCFSFLKGCLFRTILWIMLLHLCRYPRMDCSAEGE